MKLSIPSLFKRKHRHDWIYTTKIYDPNMTILIRACKICGEKQHWKEVHYRRRNRPSDPEKLPPYP